MTTTPGGLLLVAAVLVPFVGVLAGFASGRNAQRVAMVAILAGAGIAAAMVASAVESGETLVYVLGGWKPPLGVAFRADALALLMTPAIAVVILGIGAYAHDDFATPTGLDETRASLVFWTLFLAVWGSLNLVFVGGDLFTLYVALELLTFAAVPLVSLDGKAETLRAALRYLLFALVGSVFYLLGAVLLYGIYGTLDIELLSGRLQPDAATVAAAALMTVGLLAKAALFPLHLWLPPAHAGAPAAASAMLSGLVITGPWFLVVRLWFDVLPRIVTAPSAQLLAALGAAAIFVCNLVALRQERLKLLVAYSTVAQIPYLFLMFPLAFEADGAALQRGAALAGGVLQAIAHATAKAAMFMAAGLVYRAYGHDRIADLAGIGRSSPIAVLTFAVAGLALIGVPPSGAFAAKKLLLDAAATSGQWWWEVVLHLGAVLTASYVVLVLAHACAPASGAVRPRAPVSRLAEWAALSLALCSLALGLAPFEGLPNPFDAAEIGSALVVVLGGAVVAMALGHRLPPLPVGAPAAERLRRATVGFGAALERGEAVLRQWPVACLALVMVAIAFGVAFQAEP